MRLWAMSTKRQGGSGDGTKLVRTLPSSGMRRLFSFARLIRMEQKLTPSGSSDLSRSSGDSGGASPGVHLKTFTHEGRFWDVFFKVVEDPSDPDSCRASLGFLPTDRADHEEAVHTAVIIIEPSYDEALELAAGFDRYYLSAMLRSVI